MQTIQIFFMFFLLILLLNGMAGCGGTPVATKYTVTNDANGLYVRKVIPHGEENRYLSSVEKGVLRWEQLEVCSDIFIKNWFLRCGANLNLSGFPKAYFNTCLRDYERKKFTLVEIKSFTDCHERWEYRDVQTEERLKLFSDSADKLIENHRRKYQ